MFDGSWFLGDHALALGLVDGLGDLDTLVRDIGGKAVRSRVFRPQRKRGLLSRIPRLMVEAAFDAIEDRAARIDLRL